MNRQLALGIFIGMLMMPVLQFTYGALTQDSPAVRHEKPKADDRARQELWQFTKENNLDIKDFKGPYFRPILNLDFSAYVVCYKSKNHSFCYNRTHGKSSLSLR